MKRKTITDQCCPNPNCFLQYKFGEGNIIRHTMYSTQQGKRRRYRCKACGKTFNSTWNTPYYRLHKPRREFDEVTRLTVEGVSISSIARVKQISRNTVSRWQELASQFTERFSNHMLKEYELIELQADELRTFVQSKKKVKWVFTVMEVWSRLWLSVVIGRRSFANVKLALRKAVQNGKSMKRFLFTTDGFDPYAWAVKQILLPLCVYGQVIKKRRKNRVIKVNRKLVYGTGSQIKTALDNSEDSKNLNTSYIERLNLTIRQGSAYLCRRSACHAREEEYLRKHLVLLQCHYNFVRPHRTLKFGNLVKTPAMQAGIVSRKLSFREIFTARLVLFLCALVRVNNHRHLLDIRRLAA